jgi:hypothetical protein
VPGQRTGHLFDRQQRPVEASYISVFADKLSGNAWRNWANAITRTGPDPGD